MWAFKTCCQRSPLKGGMNPNTVANCKRPQSEKRSVWRMVFWMINVLARFHHLQKTVTHRADMYAVANKISIGLVWTWCDKCIWFLSTRGRLWILPHNLLLLSGAHPDSRLWLERQGPGCHRRKVMMALSVCSWYTHVAPEKAAPSLNGPFQPSRVHLIMCGSS